MGRDPTNEPKELVVSNYSSYGSMPYRNRFSTSNARSVIAAIYNRIAVDVREINMVHAKMDENDHYQKTMKSNLNRCLNIEANIDQTGKDFKQDIVESMFDEGVVAVVPVDTDHNPTGDSEAWDVLSLRTAQILEWYPQHVKVRVYDENDGQLKDIVLPKSMVAIIPNPFYATMNEPNSTLQRLLRTISKLDAQNDKCTSNKLNMIIQLPYTLKTPQRKLEADKRRRDIEKQLESSPLGIAYTDGTEKVMQLNRPIENDLWQQVKELTTELFNKMGVTQGILDGTADEATMINYYNNTIAPICSSIADEFKRKFLSKTAISQGQSIYYYRDPFKLVPVSQLADIADKFRRNEIMTSNEMRAEIGMLPSDSANAEELRNPNLNASKEEIAGKGKDKAIEELSHSVLLAMSYLKSVDDSGGITSDES
jgi:hypothetical protein